MSVSKLATLLRQGEFELYKKVQAIAERDGVSVTDILRMALLRFIEDDKSVRAELLSAVDKRIQDAKNAEIDAMLAEMQSIHPQGDITREAVEKIVLSTGTWTGRF